MQTKFSEEEIKVLHQMLDKLIESGEDCILFQKAELPEIDLSNLDDMENKIRIKEYRMYLKVNDR